MTSEELAVDVIEATERLLEAKTAGLVLTALDVDKSAQYKPPKPSWDCCKAHGAVAVVLIGEGAGRVRTPGRRSKAVKNVCMVTLFGSEWCIQCYLNYF